MKQYPKGGLIGRTILFFCSLGKLNIPLYAAYAGFFIILALFPSLLLLLSVLRYTGLRIDSLVALLADLLPAALMGPAEELVYSTWQSSSGAVLGLSAATALWSASKGIYGLLRGFNAIYDVEEDRGWLRTRLLSVFYTFLFLLVILVTLVLHVFGSAIIGTMTMIDNSIVVFLTDFLNLRFLFLLALQSLVFTLIYMALPNQRSRFFESLPGGIAASLGWLVFSDAFSIYVENFDRYSNIYGSVYAVALAMLWLYCCICILFYGGVLNRWLKENA